MECELPGVHPERPFHPYFQSSLEERKNMPKHIRVIAPGLLCALLLALVALLNLTGVAQAQTAAPSPTVPSWNKPNLHLYFVDGNGQPITGLTLRLYDVKTDPKEPTNADKTQLIKVWETTVNGQGRADFDATTVVCDRVYSLEVRDSAGNVVLPFDPNVRPRPPAGNVNPKIKDMAVLDLTKGLIVYVNKFKVQPLAQPGTSTQALAWPAESWQYWPSSNSDLLYQSQPVTGSGGSGSQTTGSSLALPTNAVRPGVSGPTLVPGALPNPTPTGAYGNVPSTPTPECRYCGLTDNPQTVAAYMTGSGRGGGGKLTPTPYPAPVLTQRAERAITDIANTVAAGGNSTISNPTTTGPTATGGVVSLVLTPGAATSGPQPGQDSGKTLPDSNTGDGFPWLLVVGIIVAILAGVALSGFLLTRKKKK